MIVPRESSKFLTISRKVEIHRKEVKALRRPTRAMPVEYFQVLQASRRPCDPEIQQERLVAKRGQCVHAPIQVGKRKIRRSHGRKQPGLNHPRKLFGFYRSSLEEGHGPGRLSVAEGHGFTRAAPSRKRRGL